METTLLIALIGVLGIGSQWLAWRLQLPAIVLMLAAGIFAGPVTGWVNPEVDFGDLFRPMVAVAVALILFDGGIYLKFKALRDAGPAVKRLVLFGAPLDWIFSTLAARYGAGLGWEASVIFGGILIVTGPTVVTPLLRKARLSKRPAEILRWEAIVNVPVGALAAVLAFEGVMALHGEGENIEISQFLALGIFLATAVGFVAGKALVLSFSRGWVPEYMKVPVLFTLILGVYALTNNVLDESGLLAVTVMGFVVGNARLPVLRELKRFKEHITVILVSGVFILLAASMKWGMLSQLDLSALIFVLLIMFIARPAAVFLSLIGTGIPSKEKLLVAWIGLRGVVAVSGLFGARLVDVGIADGQLLVPLAKTLKDAEIPVLIAARNWWRLRNARNQGIPVYYGEILSEAAEHSVDLHHYGALLAVSDNDDYNALLCADLAPKLGRSNVFQIDRHEGSLRDSDLPVAIGGRTLARGCPFEYFTRNYADGWGFKLTNISDGDRILAFQQAREGG
ncbi:MAG: sodium:proton antiporter [Rhodobacteraceae bacterium]|nr:sodium:proton antiporter [Paracoccaceae bacterium]